MILYTSELNEARIQLLKKSRNYLYISLFCALFGGIYEFYSFGVYSYFMIYAFTVPLVLGTLPYLLAGLKQTVQMPCESSRKLWGAGIAAWTVGSLFKGVLDIYGTSSPLTGIYWLSGMILLLSGMIGNYFIGDSARTTTSVKE